MVPTPQCGSAPEMAKHWRALS
uniref:Uncharacterized protein n=1 Tax=Anguilla anguilla TaxID=7936 RepID=A0A0E9RZN5_ANGAN